jgi:hypothetical protein
MDYPTLIAPKPTVGSIRNWVNYDKVDPVTVLTEAQAAIYDRLRVREMRTLDTSIVTVATPGLASYPLPANFLDPIRPLTDNQGNAFVFKTEGELIRRRNYDPVTGLIVAGTPAFWSIFGEALQFDCAFQTTGRVLNLLCFKIPPPLGPTNQTNFLTNRYPHILRRACQMVAADFMDDDAAFARMQARLEADIELAMAQNDLVWRGVELDMFPSGHLTY